MGALGGLSRAGVGRRIDSQNLHEFGDLAEMPQSVAGRFVVALQEVHEENVFPRTAAHGARFNLTEADIAQCKNAEGLEKDSREVLQRKADGRLVGATADLPRPVDQQKSGVIL